MTRATWSSRRLWGLNAVLATRSRIEPSSGPDHAVLEEGREGVALVAGEGRVRGEEGREVGVVERRLRVVLGVVEVGAGVEVDRAVGERRVRVDQVALVLGDLARRVEVVARAAAVVDGDAVGDVRPADLGPLLELDDDGGVAGGRVRAGDQDVEALGRERQLELDEDPLVGQVGELEHARHGAERVAPGRDLGRRRAVAELVEEAVRQLVGEARLRRVRDELLRGPLVEVQALSPLDRSPR